MVTIESLGQVVQLTPEYLNVSLSESTVQALRNLTSQQPILKEAIDGLLRWVDYPAIRVRNIVSVSMEAVPATPGGEHVVRVLVATRDRGGDRTYEIHLRPEDAKNLASEIENLIQKRF